MRQARSLAFAGLIWSLCVGVGIAGPPRGVTSAASHVATVEVVQHDTGAPPAFADNLRADVLREAALYGVDGEAIAMKIELDRVHLKNPVQAMIIGDNNLAKGRVTVLDPSTGLPVGAFPIRVDAERRGHGGAIAMALIGALDPTGYVSVATTVAGAASAGANRSHTEAMLSANFAIETLRQTFGDARARTVHVVKR